AASRIDVPAGTLTDRPSIVRFTIAVACVSAILGHRRHEEMLLLLDQRLEIAAELLDAGRHRSGARIAQHTNRLACHVVADFEQRVEILGGTVARDDPLENLRRPRCPFATLRALRTA